MREFDAMITETLSKTVTIEAESIEDAYAKVREKWHDSEYILDADNFVGVEFNVIPSVSYEQWELNG